LGGASVPRKKNASRLAQGQRSRNRFKGEISCLTEKARKRAHGPADEAYADFLRRKGEVKAHKGKPWVAQHRSRVAQHPSKQRVKLNAKRVEVVAAIGSYQISVGGRWQMAGCRW
jgi:hypothetical protein